MATIHGKTIPEHELSIFTIESNGGRTAMVGPDDLNFGIGWMFQAYAEADNLLVEYKTFRSIESAMDWFKLPRN